MQGPRSAAMSLDCVGGIPYQLRYGSGVQACGVGGEGGFKGLAGCFATGAFTGSLLAL